MDRIGLVLGHGEDVGRADQAGEAKAEAGRVQKLTASGDGRWWIVQWCGVFGLNSHLLPPLDCCPACDHRKRRHQLSCTARGIWKERKINSKNPE